LVSGEFCPDHGPLWSVEIHNVTGGDLVTILSNVKSKELNIYSQSLDSEETQALLGAIESRVEKVRLGDVNLTLLQGLIEILAEKVWKNEGRMKINLPLITCTVSLTQHGLHCSLNEIRLCDVNLTSVPAEHLASLASCATESVEIHKASGFGLVAILPPLALWTDGQDVKITQR